MKSTTTTTNAQAAPDAPASMEASIAPASIAAPDAAASIASPSEAPLVAASLTALRLPALRVLLQTAAFVLAFHPIAFARNVDRGADKTPENQAILGSGQIQSGAIVRGASSASDELREQGGQKQMSAVTSPDPNCPLCAAHFPGQRLYDQGYSIGGRSDGKGELHDDAQGKN